MSNVPTKRGPDPDEVEYRDPYGVWRNLMTGQPVSAERQARYEQRRASAGRVERASRRGDK